MSEHGKYVGLQEGKRSVPTGSVHKGGSAPKGRSGSKGGSAAKASRKKAGHAAKDAPVVLGVEMSGRRPLYFRYLCALVFITLMTLIAELLGDAEIIFPETLAILTGMWVVERPPWHVSKLWLVILLTASALLGYFLVAHIDCPIYVKYMTGFVFCTVVLYSVRCTVWPMFSACILPILLGTDSIIYPIAVFLLMTGVALGMWGLEELGLHGKSRFRPSERPNKQGWLLWLGRVVLFGVIAAPAMYFGQYYLVVPPLIVAYVGFSQRGNPLHDHWLKTIILFAIVALLGTCCRFLLNLTLGLPLTLVTAVSACMLFVLFELFKIHLPPIGAAALLPCVINTATIWLYPLELAAGAVVLIGGAHLVFRWLPDHLDAKRALEESAERVAEAPAKQLLDNPACSAQPYESPSM
ncbi:MAG: hypothetical protein Q4A93_03955 [Actinomycetota bacterium]|nr:hypothetical protein [Actinomycetota bacterium]